jgi:hypothetical protein
MEGQISVICIHYTATSVQSPSKRAAKLVYSEDEVTSPPRTTPRRGSRGTPKKRAQDSEEEDWEEEV